MFHVSCFMFHVSCFMFHVSCFMHGTAITLCLFSSSAMAIAGALWFSEGRPTPQAHQAIALLVDAASHGLATQDNNAAALQQAITQAAQGSSPSPVMVAGTETALTTALDRRYLSDLHTGPALIRNAFITTTMRRAPMGLNRRPTCGPPWRKGALPRPPARPSPVFRFTRACVRH
jgi:hypothetical protein